MEPLASRPEVLAVALVVESSIAVAAEWPRIIIEYVAHILKRLSDANPSHRVRNSILFIHIVVVLDAQLSFE